MARVNARWKQKSCVLRAPKSRELIVVEFVGTYKVRAPTKAERAAAGLFDENGLPLGSVGQPIYGRRENGANPSASDSPASQLVLSRTRTREDGDAEPLDEGEERGDGA